MGERLRKVAELAAGAGVVLLGEQPHVVAQREEPIVEPARLVPAPEQHQVVHQPEGAGEEEPFARRKPVHPGLGGVALDEPVHEQLTLDGGHRPAHARILGGEEAHERDHEQARVELGGAVGLHERVAGGIEAAPADILVDPLPERAPAIGRLGGGGRLGHPHHPVGRHPGHHLGVGEVPARPAHLPDALVGLGPDGFEMAHEGPDHAPIVRIRREPGPRARVGRVEHLAPDVQLKLRVRGVAHAHRRGPLVAREPRQLQLGEPPLTPEPVHDLQLLGGAREGADQLRTPPRRSGREVVGAATMPPVGS